MDIAIIGAGIIGLATGYQLLKGKPGLKIGVIEKEEGPAKHQTGRNSGVIHSGIYYKPDSLKAKNCLAGKKELLEFCEEFSLPTKKLGKVIVATEKDQLSRLIEIEKRGLANGVHLERIGPSQLKEIEPHVRALEAVWIPECSVISFSAVAEQLAKEFKKMGWKIYYHEEIQTIETNGAKIRI